MLRNIFVQGYRSCVKGILVQGKGKLKYFNLMQGPCNTVWLEVQVHAVMHLFQTEVAQIMGIK